MAKKKKRSWRDYRLVCRRSSTLLKCAVIVTVVLGTVALLSLRSSIQMQNAKAQQLRQVAIQLELENAAIQKDISLLGTVESVKKIASTELGLVEPNTTFFCPTE